jgi:hypothetical protein
MMRGRGKMHHVHIGSKENEKILNSVKNEACRRLKLKRSPPKDFLA